MFAKLLRLVILAICVIALVGCEGDPGPAGPAGDPGPNMILAYGDIDINETPPHTVVTYGPEGVTISEIEHIALGAYKVTVDGTFPTDQGTLFVTASSGVGVTNAAVCGSLESWSQTQIVFSVRVYVITTGDYDWDDFSFIIIGQ